MAILFRDDCVVLSDIVGVEDAEPLLDELILRPSGRVHADLSACAHLHPAALQVLLAAKVQVSAWPDAKPLQALLRTLLMDWDLNLNLNLDLDLNSDLAAQAG